MTNYIFNFYRNAFSEMTKSFDDSQKLHNVHIYLGHYDRIAVKEADEMSAFYKSTESLDGLKGEKQSIYLYDIDFPNFSNVAKKSLYDNLTGFHLLSDDIIKDDFMTSVNDFSFKAISLLTFTQRAEHDFMKLEDRQKLFRQIKEFIQKQVELLGIIEGDLHFKIMASLGANDVCILWATNAIGIFGKLLPRINRLNYMKNSMLFFQDYTMVALAPYKKENKSVYLSESKNTPKIQINLTFRLNANKKEVYKNIFQKIRSYKDSDLENVELVNNLIKDHVWERGASQDSVLEFSCYDIPFELYDSEIEPSINSFKLDATSEIFRKNCIHVHSRLLFSSDDSIIDHKDDDFNLMSFNEDLMSFNEDVADSSDINEKPFDDTEKEKRLNEEIERMKGLTLRLIARKDKKGKKEGNNPVSLKVSQFFEANDHTRETFRQLYYDLVRSIQTINSSIWADDLICQYDSVLKYVELELDFFTPKVSIDRIVKLIESLQHTYRHITQGSRVFFDAPGSNLSYNGSRRRLIWAYYGIVKRMIEMAYLMNRNNNQPEIIPILSFSSGTIMNSTAFPIYDEDRKRIIKNIVVFTLPYTAFYKMPTYTAYLAHEVHHYFVPTDRFTRNRILGTKLISGVLKEYFSALIYENLANINTFLAKKNINESSSIVNFTKNTIYQCAVYFVINTYKDCMEFIVGSDPKNKVSDSNWTQYQAAVFNAFALDGKGGRYPDTQALSDLLERFVSYYKENFYKDFKAFCEKEYPEALGIFSDTTWKLFIDIVVDRDKALINPEIVSILSRELKELKYQLNGVLEACCDYFLIQLLDFPLNAYLDLIADYLYTLQTITLSSSCENILLSDEYGCIVESEFGMRLFIIIKYYIDYDAEKNNNTVIDYLTSARKLLDEWHQHNNNLIEKRNQEERSIERIKCRHICEEYFYQCFLTIYEKDEYRDVYGLQLMMGNFDYTFEKFFDKSCLNPELKDFQHNNRVEFIKHAKLFKHISQTYSKIQASGLKTKRAPLAMNFQLLALEMFIEQKGLNDLSRMNGNVITTLEQHFPDNSAAAKYKTSSNVEDWFSPITKEDPICVYKHKVLYTAESVNDFFAQVRYLLERLRNFNKTNLFWFRGQANATYMLQPSIYRDYLEKANKKVHDGKTYRLQQSNFELFMAQASISVEIDPLQMRADIDWLACMQHYGIPTNLLDWSELLISAMYFMLEPIIIFKMLSPKKQLEKDTDITKKRDSIYNTGVSLYIFDPYAYNKAWQNFLNKTIEELKIAKKTEEYPFGCILDESKEIFQGYTIPNLSISSTATCFAAYVLGDVNLKKCFSDELPEVCKLCPLQLPLAIWTGKSNLRLRQQSGTFTAFSLHKTGNDYVELENIQKKWLENEINKPFLYKIDIHGEEKINELTNWLIDVGMRTFRTYPELSNIGDSIAKFLVE